jgi:hypothetical protein
VVDEVEAALVGVGTNVFDAADPKKVGAGDETGKG